MRKEQLTDKEGICLVIAFISGSTLIIGIGADTKNDAWLAGIAGILMALPMLLVYSRLSSLFLGQDLFDILENVAGKVFGRIIGVIYIWYAFHLGALVIRNFGEFINTVTMPETPMFVPMLCLGLVCIAAARAGIEVLARTATFLLPGVFAIIVVVQVLAIPQLNISFVKPVMAHGLAPILKGGFSAFSFPFAETVLFLGVFFSLKTKKSPYRTFFWGLMLAGGLIIILTIRNIMILGDLLSKLNFPSYVAVGRISIGEFLQRIEVTVAFVFVVCAYIKTSICMFVAGKGISKVFDLHDYRSVIIQIGLLMVYFSYFIYSSIMEMRFWAFKVYQYYAIPFQIILPLIIWIIAEIKMRKRPGRTAVKQC